MKFFTNFKIKQNPISSEIPNTTFNLSELKSAADPKPSTPNDEKDKISRFFDVLHKKCDSIRKVTVPLMNYKTVGINLTSENISHRCKYVHNALVEETFMLSNGYIVTINVDAYNVYTTCDTGKHVYKLIRDKLGRYGRVFIYNKNVNNTMALVYETIIA